jgi:hypothetical protein
VGGLGGDGVDGEADAFTDAEVEGCVGAFAWLRGEDDGDVQARVGEVAGHGEAIAAVVAGACSDDDSRGGDALEPVEGDVRGVPGRVLHEKERGEAKLGKCKAVELAGSLP